MRFYKHFLFFIFATMLGVSIAQAQGNATLFGKVKNENGEPMEGVAIGVPSEGIGTSSGNQGVYELQLPANKKLMVVYSYVSFDKDTVWVKLNEGDKKEMNITLKQPTMRVVIVEDKRSRHYDIVNIDPINVTVLPTPNNDISGILKTLSGVSSNNELSTQYNVRGGNYDENLVYVNDIQIYRPFLVRSGQQEGLSFPNIDLIESIKFSAGGFEAKYGDKMSSVLDITYKKPKKFGGTATASLLGGALHFEGVSKNLRFNYLFGARHRTNKYVLGSLDTKGQYFPNFTDAQTMLNYQLSPNWEWTTLVHYSRNKYTFIPEDRLTQFGTINSALQLQVYFDGQEVNSFETGLGAFSFNYLSDDKKLKLKFITSGFKSLESETFDVEGAYRLQELENNFGSDDLGKAKADIGVGGYLNHARNYLDAIVANAVHKGTFTEENKNMAWGVKYQREIILDELSEWNMIDSAGYSVPQAPSDEIQLRDVVKTTINLNSNRYSGYFQHGWFFYGDSTEHALTAGIRFNYWDLNNEIIISPRVTYSFKPNWKRDFLFRVSGGAYHQPPFYRELRDLNGNINRNIKAQKSYHAVIGADYNFMAWGRPFKYVGELYYKHLEDLIPYEIDNVRIRYYADNIAHGYAAGIDMKVNGEFVKGVESWFSLSVLQTREDIENDFYYDYYNSDGEKINALSDNNVITDSVRIEPGYIPRPTDQRVNVGIFFQDYVPKVPSLKMHLNLLFGTGLPFGPPSFERYKDTLRIPPYRRVDIGFSYEILNEKAKSKMKEKSPFKHLESAWVSLEIFNLLQVSNTISYLWVTDVNNRQYAVPNFLTARQLNLKLIVKF